MGHLDMCASGEWAGGALRCWYSGAVRGHAVGDSSGHVVQWDCMQCVAPGVHGPPVT